VWLKWVLQELYEASEFEESAKEADKIYYDALALYHAAYNRAYSERDVKKCGFVWRVAGHALCKLYAFRQNVNSSVVCTPSVLKEVFN
jgi:RNA-dependent RNA polymerase